LKAVSSNRNERGNRRELNGLREKAKTAGCNFFRLDSGTARAQAHKFYFNQGFSILAVLFSEPLQKPK